MSRLQFDPIVIGAGQAGLAAGHDIQRRGLRFMILDADHRPPGPGPTSVMTGLWSGNDDCTGPRRFLGDAPNTA